MATEKELSDRVDTALGFFGLVVVGCFGLVVLAVLKLAWKVVFGS